MQPQRQDRNVNGVILEVKHKPHLDNADNTKPKQMLQGSREPRRRISRACDQCNQLRTKCDGKNPCQHCVELGLTCEYARARKKRGKASRKDIAIQQQAESAEAQGRTARSEDEDSSEDADSAPAPDTQRGEKRKRSPPVSVPEMLPQPRERDQASQRPDLNAYSMSHLPAGLEYAGGSVTSNPLGEHVLQHDPSTIPPVDLPMPRTANTVVHGHGFPGAMGDMASIDDYHRNMLHSNVALAGQNILHPGPPAYALPSPNRQTTQSYHMGGSPLSAGMFGSSPAAGSPNWMGLPSPTSALHPPMSHAPPNPTLRHPVLRPLLPHISAIIPIGLACDLLDLYFSSTSSTFMQPQSPYILGYVFRKRSFFRDNPRPCSPALLASMLWIAAQTSESPYLTSPPSARGRICQKLLELTVGLLKPLIHASNDPTQLYGGGLVINGVALGGFGMALPGQVHEMDVGNPGASGGLDDVATYIHLATVVSASEYKAASLRWWNAAWTLARELKLGRELPTEPGGLHHPMGREPEADVRSDSGISDRSNFVPEEEREERRRIWWLLFSVDRHLALCYNRPLFLLDIECDGLLQPDDDRNWQAGEYYMRNTTHPAQLRTRGPTSECNGHGMFGYFLPLMTILGGIVDLNHARNHPRFGQRSKGAAQWDDQSCEITQQLEAYGRSLTAFENASNPRNVSSEDTSPQSITTSSTPQRMTEAALQTRIQVAYSTHLMHTFHILLHGKWDPISLLDDNDLWISSDSFVSATAHAVSAAEALNEILEYDPDLSFMPFFFGIYLLQGSFLLLLIADKLQADANPSVVKACETIVRAHEACVVTLNTEYQRNFRKVMRSALAQVRGRGIEDFGEAFRRRETLALYRWTPGGGGLAL